MSDAVCDGEGSAYCRRHGAYRGSRCAFGRQRLLHPAPFPARRHHCRGCAGKPKALAKAIGVKGLMNVQYAVKDGEIFVLEVNPRASRTVPFVAKAIGTPVAAIAAKVMAGEKLASFKVWKRHAPSTSP